LTLAEGIRISKCSEVNSVVMKSVSRVAEKILMQPLLSLL